MPGADGMNSKFMKNAFVGWTFTAGLYYPPDFDSTKLMPLKHLKPKGPQMMNIRMMFPFTMICDSCGEYNNTGTKFTAKVEDIKHEAYLGIKVYRFYGRCRHCWSEFTFKTDPKNSDYTMESGGKRTYEAWKDADMMEAQLKQEKEKEAEQDQMKALEHKAVDVQAEMQRLEDLDAILTMNKRLGARDQTIEEALEFLFKREEQRAEAENALPMGDLKELASFRQSQEERKRHRLEDDVEGRPPTGSAEPGPSTAGGSSSSASGAVATKDAPASGDVAAGSALASAVVARTAQRAAGKAAVGARLSVKRKASPRADDARPAAEKRPAPAGDVELSDALEVGMAAGEAAASATQDGGGGAGGALGLGACGRSPGARTNTSGALGLGAYDSDDEL